MKRTLILFSLLISLLPSIALTTLFFRYSFSLTENSVKNDLLREVELTSINLHKFAKQSLINTALWARSNTVRIGLDFKRPEGVTVFLNELVQQYRIYDRIFILHTDNTLFAANTHDQDARELDTIDPRQTDEKTHLESALATLASLKNRKAIIHFSQRLYFLAKILEGSTHRGTMIASLDKSELERMNQDILSRMEKYRFQTLNVSLQPIQTPSESGQFCPQSSELWDTEIPVFCISLSPKEISSRAKPFTASTILLLFFTSGISYILFRNLLHRALDPFSKLLKTLSSASQGFHSKVNFDSNYPEIIHLEHQTNSVLSRLAKHDDELQEQSRLKAIADTSRVVAHDIRSPIATLEAVVTTLSESEQQKQKLFIAALARLKSITDTLDENSATFKEAVSYPLSLCIDAIVKEKQLEFISRKSVRIQHDLNKSNAFYCASIDPTLFKRVLSNLINNSVESLSDVGTVTLHLSESSNTYTLRMTDTGCGIPEEILPKLMSKGATFNKPKGQGLGLYQASRCIKDWGGTLSLQSKVNEGTTVTIQLPKSSNTWLATVLPATTYQGIVIIDDDPSMHALLTDFLRESGIKSEIHCALLTSDVEPQLDAFKNKNYFFLVDQFFKDSTETGLEWIYIQKLESRSLLVTSSYDRADIRQSASEKNIKILPKALIPYIQVI